MKETLIGAALGVLLIAGPASAADPATIDWSKVPAKTVKLFYPGQASYQWVRSADHKRADKKVLEGAACLSCHEGEEADVGNKIAKGERHEPTPVAGKQGTIDLAVQAAFDDKNAYFRFQWKTKNPAPGDVYPFYRFDGKEWKAFGGPALNAPQREGKQPAIYEDRLSLMIDDGKVPGFAAQGCWLTCHDGLRDMQGVATRDQVTANPILGGELKKTDVRKYLPSTRSDANAAWASIKPMAEINAIKAKGEFVDLIQWRAHRSNPVGMADDGYVLEYRNFDAGKNMFASNMDAATKVPKYMFDAAKVKVKALTAANMRDPSLPRALVPDETAKPFDPNAGWKEGDLLPQYYVSRKEAAGSAADNTYAKGTWKDGAWTVVWARPLGLANPDDKKLVKGGVYTVGFAVHDDDITTRGHQVSFPTTVGLGAKAMIEAVEIK